MSTSRYRILRRLGHGSMAEVFLVELPSPADPFRLAAVKRPLPHLLSEPAIVEMFLDETRLSQRLVHPAIAAVLEVGEQEGEPFIAFEFVDGAALRSLMTSSALSSSEAAWIGTRLAAALAYSHESVPDDPIVHRDVSPENVLVQRGGEVKLIDFGVARAKGRLRKTAPGGMVGKMGYLAPEQLAGEQVGPPADVFSLGVLLHEALSAAHPFKDASPRQQMLRAARGDAAPLPPSVPEVFQTLVRAMLAPDPAARPRARSVSDQLAARVRAEHGELDAKSRLDERVQGQLPASGSFEDGTVTAVAPKD